MDKNNEKNSSSDFKISSNRILCKYCKLELVNDIDKNNEYHEECINEVNNKDLKNFVENNLLDEEKEIIHEIEDLLEIEVYLLENECLTLLNPKSLPFRADPGDEELYDTDTPINYVKLMYKVEIYLTEISKNNYIIERVVPFEIKDISILEELADLLEDTKHFNPDFYNKIFPNDLEIIQHLFDLFIFPEIKIENDLVTINVHDCLFEEDRPEINVIKIQVTSDDVDKKIESVEYEPRATADISFSEYLAKILEEKSLRHLPPKDIYSLEKSDQESLKQLIYEAKTNLVLSDIMVYEEEHKIRFKCYHPLSYIDFYISESKIVNIEFRNVISTQVFIVLAKNFMNLTKLSISVEHVNLESLLMRISKFSNLMELKLYFFPDLFDSSVFDFSLLKRLKKLKSLFVSANNDVLIKNIDKISSLFLQSGIQFEDLSNSQIEILTLKNYKSINIDVLPSNLKELRINYETIKKFTHPKRRLLVDKLTIFAFSNIDSEKILNEIAQFIDFGSISFNN